ncbi:peptidylprolyl isomerase [Novosphingobium sp.]|uniref:peptidylprolyl isomerase n=1 Tax=Novosphingobium sp. TaxID=1874826 RepID=UPI0035B1BB94
MKRRFVLAALPIALLTLTGATAKKPAAKRAPAKAAAPAPKPAPLGDTVRIVMVTTAGTIELELDHKAAPITTENFVHYVDTRRFDGMTFYRAMHLPWGDQPNGLIQAGLRGNPQKIFPPIAHEPTSQTGLSHRTGAISMARNAPGTADADFSILLSDLTSLDADPASPNPETQAGYAVFGRVVTGMDVVKAIWDSPISPDKGEGPLKGQMLDPPVKIITVRRAPVQAPVQAPAPAASPPAPVQ